MEKWEYQVIRYYQHAPDQQKQKLNDLGIMGWELVAVTESMGNSVYYLKKTRDKTE